MLSAFAESGTIFSTVENKLLIGWGEKKAYPYPLDNSLYFYFPDFFLASSHPWFSHVHHAEMEIEELIALLSPFEMPVDRVSWKNPHKGFFFDQFHFLQGLFKEGKLTKAVPFVFEESPHSLSSNQLIASLLSSLKCLKRYPGYLYGTWSRGKGLLGITPEILFKLKENNLYTHALAGTSIKEKQLQDLKILNEHQWVIQGIQNSLDKFGTVRIGKPEPLKLSHFFHLATPIQVEMKTVPTFQDIVRALHPTPALGAFPQKEGWAWLHSHQKLIDRQQFGAPVGYIREGQQANCYVAIRNVQWSQDRMLIGAGCGIVAESNPEEEWNEIQLKIKSIKELLNL